MEIEIIWTQQAVKGLSKTIEYLEKNWTTKEILRLEENINNFIERIRFQPNIYPKTSKYKNLYKGMVDETIISFTRFFQEKNNQLLSTLEMVNKSRFIN